MVKQFECPPGILTGNKIGFLKNFRRPEAYIPQIPYWGADNIQNRHGYSILAKKKRGKRKKKKEKREERKKKREKRKEKREKRRVCSERGKGLQRMAGWL